ncbi:transporter [Cerasicoccus arenae]|uniref:Porin n=1 Tax=Cerasicoccus arenae TaxID=424488 RepID=A0A8J3GDG4_9BACT|nr:hypothetical protein [Cerasicoccus arenae]MBK1857523.1 hypothetical protein [Cerasicoccus arenae]GHB95499.1 hypothetical protein GCM10007047_09120 [Cerasicoccus arenae]
MKPLLLGSLTFLAATPVLFAVYAPIPSQEQGEAFSGSITSGAYYDSNIFGSQNGRVSSVVGEISPHLDYNQSLTDQTFFAVDYDLQVLIFENRPGSDDVLTNNFLNAQIDHTFAPNIFASISDNFSYTQNPESAVIAGAPLQTDQSYFYNRVDLEALWNITEIWSLEGKFRNQFWFYDDNRLADQLDHIQYLFGVEVGYNFLPELTLIGEYRFEYNDYTNDSPPKSNYSNYALVGFNYEMSERLIILVRGGAEFRVRESAPNRNSPYGEVTAVYQLTERSYVSGAATYGIFQTTDTNSFLDQENLDLELNFEYFVFPKIAVSGSLFYQYAQMNGRGLVADANEYTYRAGVGVSYLITDNWALWVDYDYDLVDSQVPGRDQVRNRVGGYFRYTF